MRSTLSCWGDCVHASNAARASAPVVPTSSPHVLQVGWLWNNAPARIMAIDCASARSSCPPSRVTVAAPCAWRYALTHDTTSLDCNATDASPTAASPTSSVRPTTSRAPTLDARRARYSCAPSESRSGAVISDGDPWCPARTPPASASDGEPPGTTTGADALSPCQLDHAATIPDVS